MKKWKVIVGIALVFLLGVATGALVTHRAYQRGIKSFTEGGPTGVRSMMVKMMTRRLDLTPAQQVEVDTVVREAQREFQVIRQEVQPRAEEILDRATERIRKQLDVKQREKFERIVEQHRQRWHDAKVD
jgi:uncharacterized protein YneF (UPF0154 family)